MAPPAPVQFASRATGGPRSRAAALVWLERLAILVASLALSIGLIAVLSGFFAGKDQAGLSGNAAGPQLGESYPDQGDAHLRAGQPHPLYASEPPTSGAHVPEAITRQDVVINDDQLLQALSLGDVVILYGTRAPPAGLVALAEQVGGSFTPSLAAAGQAVILARRPGTQGLIGLAWRRMVRVSTAGDGLLRAFAEHWLGRGAGR